MSTGSRAFARTDTSVLREHPKRQDWFVIPVAWAPTIINAPAVQVDAKFGPMVHRSHLPVLAQHYAEAENFLAAMRSQLRLDADRIRDRAAFDAETEKLGWKLREYQHAGREFIRSRRGVLLADTMRLGKTCQLVASHELSDGPLFVVAPLTTREVWLSWFKRRWPNVRPTVLSGKLVKAAQPEKPPKLTKSGAPRKSRKRDRGYDLFEGVTFDGAELANAQLVFCNYDVLAGWKNFGDRRVGTLVFDEIHLLSNRKSNRSIAAMFLSAQADRVIGLSGTPLWNKPAGLYATLACICPGAFGKFFEFASAYAAGEMTAYGFSAVGATNEAEFKLRMQEIMLRRTWQDVVTELPAIERTVETVPITETQIFAIEKEIEGMRDRGKRATHVGLLARFRRLLAKLKIDAAIDVAKRVLDSGEHVIVWTWHRDIAFKIEEALAKVGHPGFVMTGGTDGDVRGDILARWRAAPQPTPIVLTLAVGQVGIDLSTARHEVFAELDFTPSIIAQAEMRPYNGVQPVAATYVIIDHEIERGILEALQSKCELASRIGVPAAESTVGVIAAAFAGHGGDAGFSPDDLAAIVAAAMSDSPDLDDVADDDYHGAAWNFDWEEA